MDALGLFFRTNFFQNQIEQDTNILLEFGFIAQKTNDKHRAIETTDWTSLGAGLLS